PIETTHRGLKTSQANCAASAAATLPTPPTTTTSPPPSQILRPGPTVSERGMRSTSACASSSRAAMTATGRRSVIQFSANLAPDRFAPPLGRVHGGVRMPDQGVGVTPVVGVDRDAGRDAKVHPRAVDDDR